jgi:hypothetical protein
MTVHCEGDRWVMEQLGERYEFETELTRQGFRHEDFALHVMRERQQSGKTEWVPRYAVTVVNVRTDRRMVYRSGGRKGWVARFARDLADGSFGAAEPPQPRSEPDPLIRAA